MTTALYAIFAILLFGLLVGIHEFGHYAAAKLCGVKVLEFALGMGPAIWQKQGYYNYQYLLRYPDGTTEPAPTEGNFYQTGNTYEAYVYYKGMGDRTWRLTGFKQFRIGN